MTPTIWYCFDAWCGWCYGFSPVMRKLYENYKFHVAFDVLSGGMILDEKPQHISQMAGFISGEYKRVEELTGNRFGADYLWHIHNPDQSDWYPDSLKAAISLCVFKSYLPTRAIEWATDLQFALHAEGRDLTDDEAYRHLTIKYGLPEKEFYERLKSEQFREEAFYEFQLVKQLKISGYPTVLLQVSEARFFMIGRGYTPFDNLQANLESILKENPAT